MRHVENNTLPIIAILTIHKLFGYTICRMGVKESLLGKLLGSADKFSDEQVLDTIKLLIEKGYSRGATDIHIEPQDRSAAIRYRISGNLHSVHKLPLSALPVVIEQLKVMANLDNGLTTMPQEGNIATRVDAQNVDLAISTLPVIGGEKVVLHINRLLAEPPELAQIGFWGKNLEMVEQALSHSGGLLLLCGPRKNGRTTLSHSMLKLLLHPAHSIATIEKTIEYHIPRASQTKVRPEHGLDFARAISAVLKQDPNIIMISDIPDRSTAAAIVEAATSGHLVIAGNTANDAVSGLIHVQAFTHEPVLLSTAIRAVIGHRLVRKLCVKCRSAYTPSDAEISDIKKRFGLKQADIARLNSIEKTAQDAGLGVGVPLGSTASTINTLWAPSLEGCSHCEHTGYSGALLLNEVLVPNDKIRSLVHSGTTHAKLHTAALQTDFVPLAVDGLIKALRGITSLDEVIRTTHQQ